jgi:hypothetical protein
VWSLHVLQMLSSSCTDILSTQQPFLVTKVHIRLILKQFNQLKHSYHKGLTQNMIQWSSDYCVKESHAFYATTVSLSQERKMAIYFLLKFILTFFCISMKHCAFRLLFWNCKPTVSIYWLTTMDGSRVFQGAFWRKYLHRLSNTNKNKAEMICALSISNFSRKSWCHHTSSKKVILKPYFRCYLNFCVNISKIRLVLAIHTLFRWRFRIVWHSICKNFIYARPIFVLSNRNKNKQGETIFKKFSFIFSNNSYTFSKSSL